MNDPPSDVNENIIDIFVLSVSETVTSLFTEHLEKKGYRVTLFTDGRYLLQTLREGKPNLLICDTSTLDEEGFEVCRLIKADNDLWVIPVLILAKGSSLTDLLRVLDCNADNFITHPFDPAYGLSVIDGLLNTPVERQTPEQIKTQFKISHNDQIYVVAANRRKLLEFLLSSFEITVNQSSELFRIKSEFRMLSESAKNLEDRVREQTRVIDGIRDTLRQKEQKILSLTHQSEEDKKILAHNTEVIEHFSEQLEDDKVLLTTLEKNLRESISQREEIQSTLQSEINTLRRQISELSTEIDQTKTTLDTVQGELDDERIHCTSLECTIDLQVQQKELAEKSLHTLTSEYEQLKSALADEESRAVSAETELEKVREEKTRAEDEFTQKISSLTEEIQRQTADLNRIQAELEGETNQRTGLANTLELLQKEKDRSESSLQSSVSGLTQQLGDLQVHYDRISAMLESEQASTESLRKNLDEVIAEKEKTSTALTTKNDELKSALDDERSRASSVEQELQKIVHEKTQAEQQLSRRIEDLNATIQEQTADLERLQAGLDEEGQKRISAENLAGAVRQEKEQSEQQLSRRIEDLNATIQEQTADLERLQAGLDEEGKKRISAENLAGAVRQEKEQAEQQLSRRIEALNATIQEQTADLERLQAGLDEEGQKRISAENLAGAVRQEKEQAEQALSRRIEALNATIEEQTADLERLQAGLDEEGKKRISAENLAGAVKQEKEQAEQQLSRRIEDLNAIIQEQTAELANLKAGLDEEGQKRISAENLAGAVRQEKEQAEQALSRRIEALNATIEEQTADLERLQAGLDEEGQKRISAENLAGAVKQEKDQAEQALSRRIEALNATIEGQTAELANLKAGLDEEGQKRISAENLAGAVKQEKDQAEQQLSRRIEDLNATIQEQSANLERLQAGLDEEGQKRISAENLAGAVRQEKEQAEQQLSRRIENLNATIQEQTAELANLKAGLDEEGQKRISAENLAGAVRQEKEQAESSLSAELAALKGQVAELQDKFDHTRTALSTEENRIKSLKEHIAGIVAEKEKTEEMLKTDRESYKSTFLRLKHDLDEATSIPATLEKDLIAAKSQNKALTDELNLAYQAKSQTSQQMHSLMEELEQAKAELESEKDQHLKRSESHDASRQNAERLEQELRTVSDERASLKEMIENERQLRLAADEKTKQAADKQQLLEQELCAMSAGRAQLETERSKKIQNLEKDFELVAELQKSLENQVNNLKMEKAQAEATIQALTHELDQARTALADEWEDHMISVAAAFKERQRLQQGFTQGDAQEVTKEKSPETTPSKADLSLDADSVSPSPVKGLESGTRVRMVPEKEPCSDEPETTVSEVSPRVVTDIVNIFSDDDLFETDEPASPPQNKALEQVNSTETLPDSSFTEIPDEFSESEGEGGDAVSSCEDLSGGGEDIQDADISVKDSVTPLSHGVFSFNRRQWLDLVKWARHSQNLSHDQRIQIVRMGRLIQKGRKLTKKQEEQINEMIALVQAMGYHPS